MKSYPSAALAQEPIRVQMAWPFIQPSFKQGAASIFGASRPASRVNLIKENLQRIFFVLMPFLLLSAPRDAFALFTISARPYEGGNDLRFDRVSDVGPYSEQTVILSVQSDIARQYQVVQTLLDPMTNAEGVSLSQEIFFVYGLLGSNAKGTLGVQQEMNVFPGRTILYTSNPQGDQDSFQSVYVIKNLAEAAAGSYHGRIAYTLEPIGGAEQPVTVILHVYAEIEQQATIVMKTETGTGAIRLSSARQDSRSGRILFTVPAKIGGALRIRQSLLEPLRSSGGEGLADGAVTVQVSDAQHGDIPAQPFLLSTRSESVYASSSGEADTFLVGYSLGDTENENAGLYRGRVAFVSEISGKETTLGDVSVEVEVPRRFDLIVTPKLGGAIEFHNLKVQDGPQRSDVSIEIATNIARPYQVTQKLLSPLVDKEGHALAPKNFLLKEEGLETKGRILYPEFVEVKEGDMTLFVSDSEGASDKFRVIYELSPSEETAAGDYAARIVYQISEI